MATVQDLQAAVEGEDARVIACLQDYRKELMDPECRAQVHRLTQRASQDIRMDVPLSEACFEDCSRLCGSIQPVCCPSGGCLCAGGPAARLLAAASACGARWCIRHGGTAAGESHWCAQHPWSRLQV